MAHPPQIHTPVAYLHGDASKDVFLCLEDLPEFCQVPDGARDRPFMRVISSPDPYVAYIDGMNDAVPNTSKCVIFPKSSQSGRDVNYLYGQISIGKPFVGWSGNRGNLSAGTGVFALHAGLVDPARIPEDDTHEVRVWQVNIGKIIIVRMLVNGGQIQETDDFESDRMTFPTAEIVLRSSSPPDDGESGDAMSPASNLMDDLEVPGIGTSRMTMTNAGISTVFINTEGIDYRGTGLCEGINGDPQQLARFEWIRVASALRMDLIRALEKAMTRQHTPKITFIAPPHNYHTTSNKLVTAGDIDPLVRVLSMDKLHHTMMGIATVAVSTAAATLGTLVNLVTGGDERGAAHFSHPSGTLRVDTEISQVNDEWAVTKTIAGRNARTLVEGQVRVPDDAF